jgi:hypothetical protein
VLLTLKSLIWEVLLGGWVEIGGSGGAEGARMVKTRAPGNAADADVMLNARKGPKRES